MDELTHVVLFQNIIKELKNERPDLFDTDMMDTLNQMMKTAVEHEIRWGQYITNNQIKGISNELIDRYIKWTSNERMKGLGFELLYPEINEHPMKWIETFADMNNIKTDFFEQKVTNYTKAGNVNWDDL